MPIIINVKDRRWERYEIDFDKIAKNALILKNQGSEVSITLTDDSEIRALNKKYRKIGKPTNVLSFESGDPELLGDVFVSIDTALKEAPDDFVNHATHLIVHGILHLQGMDHLDDKDAAKMESLEIKILRKMNIKNPYEDNKIPPSLAEGGKGGGLITTNLHNKTPNSPLAGESTRSVGGGYRPIIPSAQTTPNCKLNKGGVGLPKIFRALAMFLLGAAASFGFAPYYFWPLTVLSLASAYYLNDGYKTGFWWGAGYGAFGFSWMLESIFANKEIAAEMWYFYPLGLIGISLGAGIIFGLPFYMTKKTEAEGSHRVLYFALAWTFVLWLREWFLTGFPWNPIANITLPSTMLSGMMAYVGALGLTFLLIGAICSIPEYLRSRTKWQFLFFVPLMLCFFIPNPSDEMTETSVRIVHPNFGMDQKFDRARAEENLKKMTRLSESPSGAAPDLIIWPETAYPYAINSDVRMPALNAPLVLGAVYYQDGLPYNAMVLSDKNGHQAEKYFKAHLVPFGEYRLLWKLVGAHADLTPGPGPKVMGNFAPAICYEIIFSDSLIDRTAAPDYILNITNDAWFGKSKGPAQHLDMARRQAIETGLPVVRANYGGASAIIDSRGRVLKKIETAGALDGKIPESYVAPYRRIGLNKMMLIIALLSGMILLPAQLRRFGKISKARII